MGFFDNVQSAVTRGTSAAQRTGRTAQLRSQLNGLVKQRRDLAAQLGASLYDAVKDDAALCKGREPLFQGIAEIDKQREEIEAEIARIEAEANAQQAASVVYKCPKCGSSVVGGDLFCSGCGASIAEVKAAAVSATASDPAHACQSCGAPLNEGDLFCMSCGARIEAPAPEPEPEPDLEQAVGHGSVDTAEVGTEADGEGNAFEGRLDYEAESAETLAEPAVERSSAEDLQPQESFCSHCGNRVDSGDAFCAVCGSPVSA